MEEADNKPIHAWEFQIVLGALAKIKQSNERKGLCGEDYFNQEDLRTLSWEDDVGAEAWLMWSQWGGDLGEEDFRGRE